jgi:hypothetical protein
MKAVNLLFPIPVLMAIVFLSMSPQVAQTQKGVTERDCALANDAEIIWDLSELRWVCCVPADEDLETCIPITDMKPLPKTSLKPLPPKGSKTIVLPPDDSN